MARRMECDECQHVQMVGIIPNGLPAGFPDPRKKCENPECGNVGRFSAPGSHEEMQRQIKNLVSITSENEDLLRVDRQLNEIQPKE